MDAESNKKPDWSIRFVARLCLIGWVCAILYEAFDFLKPVRQICLLFGPWACIIAIVNGLFLFLIRGRALILVLVMIAIPPAIHFGIVLRNIAIEKKWIESGDLKTEAASEPAEVVPERRFTR